MNFAELLFISLGLAADAFSVSVCQGLRMKKTDYRGVFLISLFFGVFQAFMPVIGFFVGNFFSDFIDTYSGLISFALLVIIGLKMIAETVRGGDGEPVKEYTFDLREIIALATATSIDALTVGLVFTAERANLFFSVSIIGLVTFAVCVVGVVAGSRFGDRFGKKAGIVGGVVLLAVGVKLLARSL